MNKKKKLVTMPRRFIKVVTVFTVGNLIYERLKKRRSK